MASKPKRETGTNMGLHTTLMHLSISCLAAHSSNSRAAAMRNMNCDQSSTAPKAIGPNISNTTNEVNAKRSKRITSLPALRLDEISITEGLETEFTATPAAICRQPKQFP
jgi:hypothetical protein